MESLALVVSIIVMSIMVGGAISLVVAWRRPQTVWARILGSVFAVFAVLSGGWLAALEVGSGGRLIGLVVCVLGVSALWRTWRRRSASL
ncbi:MAG: hypothetical protein ACKOQ1_10800 [Actinomycetota bacterium]